jgi:hypothetical protein
MMIDWFVVFNATFSNISAISWRPVVVVEEAGVPGENHRPWVSSKFLLFDNFFFFFQLHINVLSIFPKRARVAQWVRQWDYLTTHTSLSSIRRGFAPGFVNYKKGAFDSHPQWYIFTRNKLIECKFPHTWNLFRINFSVELFIDWFWSSSTTEI